VARRPNYSWQKRLKEMDRKAKKKARREDRRQRKEDGASDVPVEPSDTLGALPFPGAKPGVILDVENVNFAN
jgi:hypothetical protein